MKQLTVYQIDSFTKEKFKGNPAGVVVNADGLSETEMLAIARELNNSETAFLFSSDDSSCDGKIRYFTPTREVPTCGHATIAAMYARALEENLGSCALKYKTQIGILPFEIIRNNVDYQVIMTQGKFELSPLFDHETAQRIVTALGLTDDDIDRRCPIQIASTGHSKVMIGIKSRKALNRLTPNFNDLAALSKVINCNGFFAFTFDSNTENILTHGRMFAPAIGINEDPVTGNANGPLGGYLIANKLAKTDNSVFEFNGMQGEQIGRPGIIAVKVTATDDDHLSIQIKGDATVAFKTTIEI
ncbi:PhzF family isomerase [Paludibacter jiangxiensis]|uniref:Phenazine biosynthesis protein PhzF family n=1 Tax=Paludibacter jiangxiensis TaxID=681398 RepID=A0A171A0T5_9BACT|nr:PhzF family isomerase [Paludibacter jiangxiensis]GAT63193.1 phenazine biosynthesis protein PhzF family [Paludibacter jiangxiensis]